MPALDQPLDRLDDLWCFQPPLAYTAGVALPAVAQASSRQPQSAICVTELYKIQQFMHLSSLLKHQQCGHICVMHYTLRAYALHSVVYIKY